MLPIVNVNDISRYATETDDTLCMCLPLMRTFIHIQDGFMEFSCVIDFIMKSTSKPQVTASDYPVENVSSDGNISRFATITEHTICMCSRLMRTQDGFMVFLCVIDFIMKYTSWPVVTLSFPITLTKMYHTWQPLSILD